MEKIARSNRLLMAVAMIVLLLGTVAGVARADCVKLPGGGIGTGCLYGSSCAQFMGMTIAWCLEEPCDQSICGTGNPEALTTCYSGGCAFVFSDLCTECSG